MSALRNATMATGGAVWDFFVGDTPEVLVIVAITVALAYAFAGHAAGFIILPLVAVIGLGASVWWGCRSER
jgi:hypothetical protein